MRTLLYIHVLLDFDLTMPRDGALAGSTLSQPRAYGGAEVGSALKAGRTRLNTLRQSGSAKVLLPQTAGDDLAAILLNTAGGITGGDKFTYKGHAGAGSFLTLSTQAAERAYRAQPGEYGQMTVTLRAEDQELLP